jgi:hypothetical protein
VPLKVLGHGRAAQARLVQLTLADGQQMVAVEKVFRPALLTRFIYRVAFQAPFAYQSNQHAILACFYRRRVAGAIVEATGLDARVAEPLYVRWDAEAEAFVLGSEFIRGRGIVPQPTDSHTMRRWLAAWIGKEDECPARPDEEIHGLLDLMTRLEHTFRSCGLEGTGWQVCKRALVSTANLLRTREGYTVVDLESGIPAVLVPTYLIGGLRLGAVPPFDDVDADMLREWLDSREGRLINQLGRKRYEQLRGDAERLIEHTAAWKHGEPALGRNKWRVFGRECREQFKQRCLDTWRRRDIIDEESATKIRPGRRIFSRMTFWLGLVPGAAGRFMQRLWANRPYRGKVRQFLSDATFRRSAVRSFVGRYTNRWREAGRIARTREFGGITLRFLINGLLASLTPAGLHRWFSDRVHRRNVLTRMMLICVSARFQGEYGRYLIRTCIRQWENAGRLTPIEAMHLRRQLECSDMDEYVRCFGMHMGLKLLLPLLLPLKVGGGAAFIASGNLWFLFILFLMPACRTAITLWRMLLRKRPAVDYLDALLVGTLPTIGSLAYPVQMYSKYRELSAFLLRDSAARMGRWVPIYGGKDSRIEIWAIKMVNYVAECLEIGLAGTAPLRRRMTPTAAPADARPRTIDIAASRWHRLANEQLRLIAECEATTQSLGEFVADVPDQDRGADAA